MLARPDLHRARVRTSTTPTPSWCSTPSWSTRRRSSTCACARRVRRNGAKLVVATQPARLARPERRRRAALRAGRRRGRAGAALAAGARRGEGDRGRPGRRAPARTPTRCAAPPRRCGGGAATVDPLGRAPLARPARQAGRGRAAGRCRARSACRTGRRRPDRGARRPPTGAGCARWAACRTSGPASADAPAGRGRDAAAIAEATRARCSSSRPTRCAPTRTAGLGARARPRRPRVIAFADFLDRGARRARRRRLPGRVVRRRRRAPSPTRTAASSACARRSATPARCAPSWRCSPSCCARLGAARDGELDRRRRPPDRAGRAVLRRPDARGDRRPRRALAGARGRRGARARRRCPDAPLETPPASRPRACAWAPRPRCGPAARRARRRRCASSRRSQRVELSPADAAPARRRAPATRSRWRVNGRACARRRACATGVPAGSVFLVEGVEPTTRRADRTARRASVEVAQA